MTKRSEALADLLANRYPKATPWPRPTPTFRHIVREYRPDLNGHIEPAAGALAWSLDERGDDQWHTVTRGTAASWSAAREAADRAAADLARGGRPAIGPKIELRLDPGTLKDLDEVAAMVGLTRAEWCRQVLTAETRRALHPQP